MASWRDLRVDPARLRADIVALSRIGRSAEGVLTRHAFSADYEAARDWLKARMEAAGIAARDDTTGNTIGRVGPASGPCVMAGSHIDTVPDGGPLDGALGVLSALEVARVLSESGSALPRAFECVAFVEEEGRYSDCLGSKAMTGQIEDEEVAAARDPDGNSLADAMGAAGFDPGGIGAARRPGGDVAAYLELHIEQGPVLESMGLPIGVVHAIVGIDHTSVIFRGEPDHAGTTPMDLRKDAFTGAAEYAYRTRQMVLEEGTEGRARITFGVVELQPQATNIVPYRVRLIQEIRDTSDDVIAKLVAGGESIAGEVAAAHRLSVDYEWLSSNKAAHMSEAVQAVIRDAAASLGLASHDMPSGAGHDAQVLANVAPAGMIFVPSEGGRSHRRDEWTDWPLLENGANVLLQSALRLIHGSS